MKEKESVGAFYLSIFPIDSKKNCFKYPLTVALLTMTRSPFQGELYLAKSIEVKRSLPTSVTAQGILRHEWKNLRCPFWEWLWLCLDSCRVTIRSGGLSTHFYWEPTLKVVHGGQSAEPIGWDPQLPPQQKAPQENELRAEAFSFDVGIQFLWLSLSPARIVPSLSF